MRNKWQQEMENLKRQQPPLFEEGKPVR